ncbi:hypothetical protein D9M69_532240 [compost metagenome]
MRPDRAEKGAMRNLLSTGVDRRRLVLRPVRTPAPVHAPGHQVIALEAQQARLRCWRQVVPGRRLLNDDRGFPDIDQRDDLAEGPELGNAAAHGAVLSRRWKGKGSPGKTKPALGGVHRRATPTSLRAFLGDNLRSPPNWLYQTILASVSADAVDASIVPCAISRTGSFLSMSNFLRCGLSGR